MVGWLHLQDQVEFGRQPTTPKQVRASVWTVWPPGLKFCLHRGAAAEVCWRHVRGCELRMVRNGDELQKGARMNTAERQPMGCAGNRSAREVRPGEPPSARACCGHPRLEPVRPTTPHAAAASAFLLRQ